MRQLSAPRRVYRHHRSDRGLDEHMWKGEPPPENKDGNDTQGAPRSHDASLYLSVSGLPPATAPPARAVELVKEEVHRALQAFSTRPIKGAPIPRLPSDLLRPFDVTKDGLVNYADFKEGLRGLGISGLMDIEAEAMAREVDVDGTGLIARDRFETAAIEHWGGTTDCSGDGKQLTSRRRTRGGGEEQNHTKCNEPYSMVDAYGLESETGCVRGQARPLAGSDSAKGKDRVLIQRTSDHEALLPPPRPPVARRTQIFTLQHSDSGCRSSSPTISFEDWRRLAHGRGKNASIAVNFDSSGGGRREAGVVADDHRHDVGITDTDKVQQRRHHHQHRPLQTLRSLLEADGFDSTAGRVDWQPGTAQISGQEWRRSEENSHHEEGEQVKNRLQAAADGDGGSAVKGDGFIPWEQRREARERGRSLVRVDRQSAGRKRPASAPAGTRARNGSVRSGGRKSISSSEAGGGPAMGRREAELRRTYAARAESILRLRSRRNLVGLRRALSKADPSASGVVSQRELERVILRRFGAGLQWEEANELSRRYRRELSGRSMVDYNRLVDSLEEAAEVGVPSAAAGAESQRGLGRSMDPLHGDGGQLHGRRLRRSASAVDLPKRSGGRACAGNSDSVVIQAPAEESQLVRRARSKTLALLRRHGSRSVGSVFQLVDPARTESLTPQQLREGLRILAGSDPLTDVEYRALFRDVSNSSGEIRCRELLDALRAAEAQEYRGHAYRRMAREAKLPSIGRGSAIHFRRSDVTDWCSPPPPGKDQVLLAAPSRGRQHPETRRDALAFQKLRNSVRNVQDDRGSAGPVFDIFHRSDTRAKNTGTRTPPPRTLDQGGDTRPALSPEELRAGLHSLGLPLGDADLVTLVANTDPSRRGKVTYADFCDALRLHRISDDHSNRSSHNHSADSAGLLSSYEIGRDTEPKHGGGGGLGSGRRTAMELAPTDDLNLDGGVFHRNLATEGCPNPNFTTTMIPVGAWSTISKNEQGGRARGRARANSTETSNYRPSRRQSPAPAPSLRYNGCRPDSQGQSVLVSDNHSRLWNSTGEEAELSFRHVLGIKTKRRRPRSASLSASYQTTMPPNEGARASGPHNGWVDNHTDIIASADSPRPNVGWTDGFITTMSDRNRRGRSKAPRDSDLGFGSDRMLSRVGRNELEDISGRRIKMRRPRSFSVGAERRYGGWARSSVQNLLRHDCWLGVRTTPSEAPATGKLLDSYGVSNSKQGVREHAQEPENTSDDDNKTRATMAALSAAAKGAKVTRMSARTADRRGNMSYQPLHLRDAEPPRSFTNNYSRHPWQVTQRRAMPYATDLDSTTLPGQQGIRTGGDVSRGGSNQRSRGRSAVAHPRTAATPPRSRDLARAHLQADLLTARGRSKSAAGRCATATSSGGLVRSYAGAPGAGRRGGVLAGAKREGAMAGSWERTQGWSEVKHAGGELSPTLRWSDQKQLGFEGRGHRKQEDAGAKARVGGGGYLAGFKASSWSGR